MAVKTSIAVIAIIIALIAGIGIGYIITPIPPATTITTTVLKTETTTVVSGAYQTITVTTTPQVKTITITTTVAGAQYTPPEKIKAAWIYVGPVGDYGWSYMHDVGRRVVAELYKDWLETTYVESVSKEGTASIIDDLVRKGYTVIFTTSFDHMDPTYDKAKEYPNIMFFHCSGYKRAPNMGTYFADLYQVYYLNGLMAGALTKTGKLGYIAAHTIPEVVRHINAFAIGAMEMGRLLGKNITVYVIEIGSWVAPDKAIAAAETFVREYNVDAIAFTEDTTATVEFAEKLYRDEGKQIYVFSHYSPMYSFGPDVVVSGQLVRWEVIYADILAKVKAGIYRPGNLENVDYWYLLNTGAVELGAEVYPNGTIMMINPKFIPALKEITVRDPIYGDTVSAYDYVMRRYYLMREAPMLQSLQGTAITHLYESLPSVSTGAKYVPTQIIASMFDPFIGPLQGYCIAQYSRFCQGKPVGAEVTVPAGERLTHDDLWNMDWFVKGVIYMGMK